MVTFWRVTRMRCFCCSRFSCSRGLWSSGSLGLAFTWLQGIVDLGPRHSHSLCLSFSPSLSLCLTLALEWYCLWGGWKLVSHVKAARPNGETLHQLSSQPASQHVKQSTYSQRMDGLPDFYLAYGWGRSWGFSFLFLYYIGNKRSSCFPLVKSSVYDPSSVRGLGCTLQNEILKMHLST